MRNLLKGMSVAVIAATCCSSSGARILRVPQQYPQIQIAIGMAIRSDTVLVSPGVYQERIDFFGKEILVGSLFVTAGDTAYVASTVIDPGNLYGPVVSFIHSEGRGSVIRGLTIRDGRAANGAGIYCDHASPTIIDNVILANSASREGGGIYAISGDPLVARNRLERNHASVTGGGCRFVSGMPDVEGNAIHSNTSSGTGGGVSLESANALIAGNVIDSCLAYGSVTGGGGIYVRASSSSIRGNVIRGNAVAYYGGGICEDHRTDAEPGSLAEGNLFDGNVASEGGGAIYIVGGAPVYEGNTIHGNLAFRAGGGILSEHSDLVLRNNEICHNGGVSYAGGGMQSRDGAFVIEGNSFHDNSTAGGAGGGLFY